MLSRAMYLATYGLLLLANMQMLNADEHINYIDARNMLAGNTVEGKNIVNNKYYRMYLHPTGQFIREESDDVSEKGSWRISDNGQLCLQTESEICLIIKLRDDEGYNLYKRDGHMALTIDKVIIGNPDKLKP